MDLYIFIISFMFYSFVGWFYESTICSYATQGKFVNRGFLQGPLCPIYGSGALLAVHLLGGIKEPIVLFVVSMLLSSVFEYSVSYAMEVIFHARWWDYSEYKFNLHGRICLLGTLLFGTGFCLIIYVVQPFINSLLSSYPRLLLQNVSLAFVIILLADIAFTLNNWISLNKHLRTLLHALDENAESFMANIAHMIEANRGTFEHDADGIRIKLKELSLVIKNSELRFFFAFPKLRLYDYESLLQKLDFRNRLKRVYDKIKETADIGK